MQLLLHAMSGRALSRTACRRMRRLSLTTSVWLHPPPSPPPPHAALGLAARRLHLRAALRAPDSAESQLSSLLAQHTVHLLPVQSAFLDGVGRAPSRCVSVNRSLPLSMLLRFVCHAHPHRLLLDAANNRPGYAAYLTPDADVLHHTMYQGVLDTFFGLPSRSSAQRASAAQSLLFAARTELRALCLLRLIAHATEWPQLVAVNDAALSSPLPHAVEGEAGELRFDCLLLTQPPHGSHPQQLQQPHSPAHPALIAFHDVLSAEGLSVALQQAGIRVNGGAVWAVRVGGSWYSVRLMHDLHRLARLTNARVDRSPPVPV